MPQITTAYNAKNERVKRDYLRHIQEAKGRAQRTVDAARKVMKKHRAALRELAK